MLLLSLLPQDLKTLKVPFVFFAFLGALSPSQHRLWPLCPSLGRLWELLLGLPTLLSTCSLSCRMIADVDTDSPREVFFRVAADMFADGNFNWGRVVALFYFASKLVLKVSSSRVTVCGGQGGEVQGQKKSGCVFISSPNVLGLMYDGLTPAPSLCPNKATSPSLMELC